MEILEVVRYWIGVLVATTLLPAIIPWFLIHPFVSFWRKRGQTWVWLTIAPISIAILGVLVWFRDALLGPDYGLQMWRLVPALVLILAGGWIDWSRRKYLTTRILVGIPELKGDASNLLTGGPYAYVRHPRYVAIFLSYLGFALFANRLGPYLFLAGCTVLLRLVIWLEERELRERFGQPFEAYQKRTPLLFPKFTGKS